MLEKWLGEDTPQVSPSPSFISALLQVAENRRRSLTSSQEQEQSLDTEQVVRDDEYTTDESDEEQSTSIPSSVQRPGCSSAPGSPAKPPKIPDLPQSNDEGLEACLTAVLCNPLFSPLADVLLNIAVSNTAKPSPIAHSIGPEEEEEEGEDESDDYEEDEEEGAQQQGHQESSKAAPELHFERSNELRPPLALTAPHPPHQHQHHHHHQQHQQHQQFDSSWWKQMQSMMGITGSNSFTPSLTSPHSKPQIVLPPPIPSHKPPLPPHISHYHSPPQSLLYSLPSFTASSSSSPATPLPLSGRPTVPSVLPPSHNSYYHKQQVEIQETKRVDEPHNYNNSSSSHSSHNSSKSTPSANNGFLVIPQRLSSRPSMEDASIFAGLFLSRAASQLGFSYAETWSYLSERQSFVFGQCFLSSFSPTLTRFSEASSQYEFPLGSGIPGRSSAQNSIVVSRDVAALDQTIYPRSDLARSANLHSAVAMPLVVMNNRQQQRGPLPIVAIFYRDNIGNSLEADKTVRALQHLLRDMNQERDMTITGTILLSSAHFNAAPAAAVSPPPPPPPPLPLLPFSSAQQPIPSQKMPFNYQFVAPPPASSSAALPLPRAQAYSAPASSSSTRAPTKPRSSSKSVIIEEIKESSPVNEPPKAAGSLKTLKLILQKLPSNG